MPAAYPCWFGYCPRPCAVSPPRWDNPSGYPAARRLKVAEALRHAADDSVSVPVWLSSKGRAGQGTVPSVPPPEAPAPRRCARRKPSQNILPGWLSHDLHHGSARDPGRRNARLMSSGFHATVFALPAVMGGLRDSVFPGRHLLDGSRLQRASGSKYLAFCKTRLASSRFFLGLLSRKISNSQWHYSKR
jgi:hypothetical protein